MFDRREFLKKTAAGVLGTSSLSSLDASKLKSYRKPNIILILADDVSAKEFSCYGGTGINTPNLYRMATEGVMFRTAWTSPVCGPSRAMLQTGRYPFHTKYFGNNVLPIGKKLCEGNILMAQALKTAGYKSAMFGKIHHGGNPVDDYGFDEYCVAKYWEGYNGPAQIIGQGMYKIQWYWHPGLIANGKGIQTNPNDFGPDIEVNYLNDFVRRHKDEPFFVYWPTNLPHMEFNQPAKWNYTDVPQVDSSGKKTGQKVRGSLKSNLEYLDNLIGRILTNLDNLNVRRNTIVMFCGDNGTAGYGKNSPESEKGPRVPFIVDCPGLVKQTGPCDELVDFSDVLPTLVELSGSCLPDNYKIDGHSFAPLILGKPYKGREWIFTELNDMRWLRDKRWLLDANGRFYDSSNGRDETKGYRDVTDSNDTQVVKARRRFDIFLESLPKPDYDDPELKEQWDRHFKSKKSNSKKAKKVS